MLQERPTIVLPQALHERFAGFYDDECIIMDLSGVDIVDTVFLAELARLRTYRLGRGLMQGRLVVDSQNVRNALSAVGFERNWPIFKTVDEAVASFDGPPLYA